MLVVVALALIASLVLPKEMALQKEETINAPMEVVWENINSFQKSDKWSPWYDIDPDMKVEFQGEEGTVGSSFTWSGNDQVQSGKQIITAIDAQNHTIESKVEHNWGVGVNKMWLEDAGDGQTKIVTSYNEVMGIPGNLFGAIMGAEDMMGDIFAKGLGKLKTIAEEQAAELAKKPSFDVQMVERPATRYVGKKETHAIDDLQNYFSTNMPIISDACKDIMAGPPSALYWSWDIENMQSELTVAMPISADASAPDGYEVYEQPSGSYLLIDYFGPYDNMEAAHTAVNKYMTDNNLELNGAVMEEYISGPATTEDSSKWLTKILYPVKAAAAGTEDEATEGNEG